MSICRGKGGAQEEGTLHAKFMVVDRKSMIVGSYNLDPRSELLNSESALAVENEKLSGELARQFIERDLPKAGTPVSPQEAERFHQPKDIRELFRLHFSITLDQWVGF